MSTIETTIPHILESLENKFPYVFSKITNKNLTHKSAWEEIQPLLSYMNPGFPSEYGDLTEQVRRIFFIRRQEFFDPEFRQIASDEVKAINDALKSGKDRTKIGPISFTITSLFKIPAYKKRK